MQDEKALVERAKHGDPEAFAQLYEKYVNKIVGKPPHRPREICSLRTWEVEGLPQYY